MAVMYSRTSAWLAWLIFDSSNDTRSSAISASACAGRDGESTVGGAREYLLAKAVGGESVPCEAAFRESTWFSQQPKQQVFDIYVLIRQTVGFLRGEVEDSLGGGTKRHLRSAVEFVIRWLGDDDTPKEMSAWEPR